LTRKAIHLKEFFLNCTTWVTFPSAERLVLHFEARKIVLVLTQNQHFNRVFCVELNT